MDDKYIVFKREEFLHQDDEWGLTPVEDAVVIRRQDIFAPPALEAYAATIQTVIELSDNYLTKQQLQPIADYFHNQATLSWDTNRKVPD